MPPISAHTANDGRAESWRFKHGARASPNIFLQLDPRSPSVTSPQAWVCRHGGIFRPEFIQALGGKGRPEPELARAARLGWLRLRDS
ncbi:MAG: hypothetical protein JO312_16660 [Hyphomicrobiales bacterium]|nr:hypothetical protein [Hyphomicrobiales bacterium]